MSNRPKAYSWMRVDLEDYLRGIHLGLYETHRQAKALIIPHPVPIGGAALDGFVIEGFAVTGMGLTVATVALGTSARAILSETVDATIHHGVIAEDEIGAATITLDLTVAGVVGINDLWVRHVPQPGNPGTRAYWNDTTAAEFLQSQDMDDQPRFELGISVAPALPAGWTTGLKIAELDLILPLLAINAIVPTRVYLFEGPEVDGFAPNNAWGAGADRNNARDVDGVHDLYTHIQMVRRQLQDIIGAAGFHSWSAISTNLPSLENLGVEHYPEDHGVYENHHKSFVVAADGVSANIIFRTATLDDSRVYLGPKGLVFDRPTIAGPSVRLVLSDAATDGGVIISGPDGVAGGDMDLGEDAHLRFGDPDAVPWTISNDFALVARGAAADADRELGFEVAAADVVRMYGDGRLFLGGATAQFGYISDKIFTRSFSASDWTHRYGTVAATGYLQNYRHLNDATPPPVDLWFRVYEDAAARRIDGWAIQNVSGSNNPIANPPGYFHLISTGAWIAKGMTLDIDDPVTIDCEADNVYLAAGGELQVLLVENLGASCRQLAYATVVPPDAAGPGRGRTASAAGWTAAVSWPGGPQLVLDPADRTYAFMVVPHDNGGGAGAIAGNVAVYGVTVSLRVGSIFQH